MQRSQQWAAQNGFEFEQSGAQIELRFAELQQAEALDCGYYETPGYLGKSSMQKFGTLNLDLNMLEPGEVHVTASMDGEFQVTAPENWDVGFFQYFGRCMSSGLYEQDLLDFIEG
ncbi:hypothetical protein GCM10023333_08940 [Ferrimonas pelagia]|uniref:Uncharacterized protein n=1 Tax=Ferrimonas pelagia TaxID=1177826 RepID=A0ABP9EL12_9GAMM